MCVTSPLNIVLLIIPTNTCEYYTILYKVHLNNELVLILLLK